MNNNKQYRFRAECFGDVRALQSMLPDALFEVRRNTILPDVEVTLSTELSQDEVVSKMADIPDSHVMIETLADTATYSGERNYPTSPFQPTGHIFVGPDQPYSEN